MTRLVSSSEAAEILGLSLQGVHYRIKKAQLKSMKKDGKTYVYIDKELVEQFHNKQQQDVPSKEKRSHQIQTTQEEQALEKDIPQSHKKLYELVYKAKEDQIQDLKDNLEAVKEQYKTEIYRLDKNQKQILEVFQSEVDLLKSAFHEMKNVYQLEHNERMEDKKHQYAKEEIKQQQEQKIETADAPKEQKPVENLKDDEIEIPFMDLKEFYAYMKGFNKTDAQIKNIVLERVKAGDKRFIYKKGTKEVIIFRSDFIDLI